MTMTTTHRLALFDTATHCIGLMMAYLSAQIYQEQHKANPDLVQIDAWYSERDAYDDERGALRYDDVAGQQAAIAKYGPVIQAFMRKPDGPASANSDSINQS